MTTTSGVSAKAGGRASASGSTTSELRVTPLNTTARCAGLSKRATRPAMPPSTSMITAKATKRGTTASSGPSDPVTAATCEPTTTVSVSIINGTIAARPTVVSARPNRVRTASA